MKQSGKLQTKHFCSGGKNEIDRKMVVKYRNQKSLLGNAGVRGKDY